MAAHQSEKEGKAGWSDVFAVSFWSCVVLILYSIIPVLTILVGILTIQQGLLFWGLAITVLGLMALIGPFYAASRAKKASDE